MKVCMHILHLKIQIVYIHICSIVFCMQKTKKFIMRDHLNYFMENYYQDILPVSSLFTNKPSNQTLRAWAFALSILILSILFRPSLENSKFCSSCHLCRKTFDFYTFKITLLLLLFLKLYEQFSRALCPFFPLLLFNNAMSPVNPSSGGINWGPCTPYSVPKNRKKYN